jgi:hypothetical protein
LVVLSKLKRTPPFRKDGGVFFSLPLLYAQESGLFSILRYAGEFLGRQG